MARAKKNPSGLTPQQEAFCRFVAYDYGEDAETSILAAYRKAYNCTDKPAAAWQRVEASRLMDNPNITLTISRLREESAKLAEVTMAEILSRDAKVMNFDPLNLYTPEDPEAWPPVYRRRTLDEIPKYWRLLLEPTINRSTGEVFWDVNKNSAINRLVSWFTKNQAQQGAAESDGGNVLIDGVKYYRVAYLYGTFGGNIPLEDRYMFVTEDRLQSMLKAGEIHKAANGTYRVTITEIGVTFDD